MEIPFVGGAYTGYSSNINAQRCVNLFPAVDNEQAKNVVSLYGTPGLLLFSETDSYAPVRGLHEFGDVLYAIVGATVYSVTAGGVATDIGDISTATGNVYMSDNGVEVIIVDGSASGYLITGGVLSLIIDPDFPASSSVTFQDGFFLVTETNTEKVYRSGLYDGTSWDALVFGVVGTNPDNLQRIISNASDLWLIGDNSAEVYYNTGKEGFNYEIIPGAILEIGIAADASAVKIDEVIYWLSSDKTVVQTYGYKHKRISTTQIDYQISTYDTVSDAKGFTYNMLGHEFYVLTFPTEAVTWVYDITTGFWHEWSSYYGKDVYSKHRANCITKFGDKHIVGDCVDGLLYELDMDTHTDNLEIIRRLRTTQVINNERFWLIWHRLQIDFEVGVGLVGEDEPTCSLKWSDDGGHTWANEHWKTMGIGDIGEYSKRVIWRRLGKSRNRIWHLMITDPVKVVILGAYADIEECVA